MEQTIYTCVVCGGEIEPIGKGLGKCIYCRSKQSIPTLNLEKLERANALRRDKDYHDALRLYEEIISESPNNAEAYWGAVLCRYGIEFVEDYDGTAIPTCNRTVNKPITEDPDFKYACQYAEGDQKEYYIKQAEIINEKQNKILELVSKEKPYDVFISYKAKDTNGNPTSDSKEAMKLYYKLEKEGYKVFFAEITLTHMVGQDYEPHIYAALTTSKVMILIGSNKENLNAVWVKNEWSRYLDMAAEDQKKKLAVVYYDMKPEDLPMELKKNQAVDWKTPEAMNIVMDTVKKYVKPEKKEEHISSADFDSSVQNVLNSREQQKSKAKYDNALILAKSGNINAAMSDINALLFSAPDYAEGHWLKLCLLNGTLPELISQLPIDFHDHPEYLAAVKFADGILRNKYETTMQTCLDNIFQRDSYSRELYELTQSYCSMNPAKVNFNTERIKEIKQILSDKKTLKANYIKPFSIAGFIVCMILMISKIISFSGFIGDSSLIDDMGVVSLFKMGVFVYMILVILIHKGLVGKAGIVTGVISILTGFLILKSDTAQAYISSDSIMINNFFDILILSSGILRTVLTLIRNGKNKKIRNNSSKLATELNQLLGEALTLYQNDANTLFNKYNRVTAPMQPIIDPSFSQLVYREFEELKKFNMPVPGKGKKNKKVPKQNNQKRR